MVSPVASPLAKSSKVTLSGLMPSASSASSQAFSTETATLPAPVKTFTKPPAASTLA